MSFRPMTIMRCASVFTRYSVESKESDPTTYTLRDALEKKIRTFAQAAYRFRQSVWHF
jgi:hypothetical protein